MQSQAGGVTLWGRSWFRGDCTFQVATLVLSLRQTLVDLSFEAVKEAAGDVEFADSVEVRFCMKNMDEGHFPSFRELFLLFRFSWDIFIGKHEGNHDKGNDRWLLEVGRVGCSYILPSKVWDSGQPLTNSSQLKIGCWSHTWEGSGTWILKVQDVNLLSSFKILAKYITLEYLPTYPTLDILWEKIIGILANLYTNLPLYLEGS